MTHNAENDALREAERRIEAARNKHWQTHLREHPHATFSSCPRDYGIHDAYAHAANIVRDLIRENRVIPPDKTLPLHRTEAGYPRCSTCDGDGCLDCTDPA